jgi:transcriptional regulator with XRE-family HTH domain
MPTKTVLGSKDFIIPPALHLCGHGTDLGVASLGMRSRRSNSGAGERLKTLRLQARMTTRDVENLSLQISQSKSNPEFYISHAWLTDIENGEFTPSIYKLYALSAIYHTRFTEMLGYFGLNLSDNNVDLQGIRMPRTQLVTGYTSSLQDEVRLPIQVPTASELLQTKLVSELSAAWHGLPVSVLQYLNSKDRVLGYVGLQDFTLYPVIRPGSFVEINARQNRVRAIPWTSEHDRPIYFVELRDRYVCSWCQLDDRKLSVVPHPVSNQQIQRFTYPDEAEIVGRVTAVAMRIADSEGESSVE